MFVFRKIWRALFSWNTRFEIRPFVLLPMDYCVALIIFLAATFLLQILTTSSICWQSIYVYHPVWYSVISIFKLVVPKEGEFFTYFVGNKAKGRISNRYFKKTKRAKFSEKRRFLTPWYAHAFALLPTIWCMIKKFCCSIIQLVEKYW